jgi:hypothetical protein
MSCSIRKFSYITISFLCFWSNFSIAAERPIAVASYEFNNSLSALEANVEPLTAIDPFGQNRFVEEVIFGETRWVYRFDGDNSSNEDGSENGSAGLVMKTAGLFEQDNSAYTVEMLVKFDRDAIDDYISLMSVSNRHDDVSQLSITPNNQAIGFSQHSSFEDNNHFISDTYRHLIISVKPIINEGLNHVSIYLDGQLVYFNAMNSLNLNRFPNENPNQLIHFFVEGLGANSFPDEYSDGQVALIRLYNTVLSADEAQLVSQTPFIVNEDNECEASYAPEGLLTMPCVSLANAQGGVDVYDVDFQLVDNIRPFTFILTRADVNSSSFLNNECISPITLGDSFTLKTPCLSVSTVFNGVKNYQANFILFQENGMIKLSFSDSQQIE